MIVCPSLRRAPVGGPLGGGVPRPGLAGDPLRTCPPLDGGGLDGRARDWVSADIDDDVPESRGAAEKSEEAEERGAGEASEPDERVAVPAEVDPAGAVRAPVTCALAQPVAAMVAANARETTTGVDLAMTAPMGATATLLPLAAREKPCI
jgi:hypothetical protein